MSITAPLPLGERLTTRSGIPVIVENDAKCCCWSEMAFRRSPPARNFIALLGEFRNVDVTKHKISGIAFGMGIVIRDNVLHGDTFTAGEFRSLRYNHERPGMSQFSISDDEALRLPDDKTILGRVFEEVAYNVSLIVNSLDITKIVITGDFAKYSAEITPILRREIGKNWLYDTPKNVMIDYSPDGENAVCMGAAGMFIQKLFSVPGMTDHLDEEVGFLLLEKILRAKAGGIGQTET
jgi:predicted NBD/HSP70 family sugar kinase